MPPKFYFTTKSELAEEERKRFLKEVEELPPTAPLRQDLSAFLPATRDNTTTTSPYEQSQQAISQERYIKEQDRKRTALSGRTYGENKFIREGGEAIEKTIAEFSPVEDVRDVERAVQDPSLWNLGVAGAAMIPVVGKGLKKVTKGVRAVDSAKNLQKLDNAIIKNNPELERLFSGYRSREDGIKLFPEYDEAGKIASPQDAPSMFGDLGKISESEIQSIRKFAKATGNKTDEGIARMIAAVKAGYTTPAFHSTKADIARFEDEKLGTSTGAESAQRAHFFAENPITSSGYADVADAEKLRPDIKDISKKDENELNATLNKLSDEQWDLKHSLIGQSEDAWDEFTRRLQKSNGKKRHPFSEAKKIMNEYMDHPEDFPSSLRNPTGIHGYDGHYSDEAVEFVKEHFDELKKIEELKEQYNPKVIDLQKKMDKIVEKSLRAKRSQGQNMVPVRLRLGNNFVYDAKGRGYRDFSFSDVIDKAKEEGYDSVTFKDVRDGVYSSDPITNIHAVFDTQNIRSPFAEFDLDKVPKSKSNRVEKMKGAIEKRYKSKSDNYALISKEIEDKKEELSKVTKEWKKSDGGIKSWDAYDEIGRLEFEIENLEKVRDMEKKGALGFRKLSKEDKKAIGSIFEPLKSIPKFKEMEREVRAILSLESAEDWATGGNLTARTKMKMKEALGDKYQDWEDKLYLLRDNRTYQRREFITPIDLMDRARKSKMRGASSDLLAGVGGLGLGIKAIRDEKNKKETK